MRNIFKKLLGIITLSVFLLSCEKDEIQDFFEGGTPPVLTADRATISMSYANRDNLGLKLMWTNPDYKFTTGTSSQDVKYQIEIDTTGANFTNPKRKIISFSKDLFREMTQGELNDYLLNQLELYAGAPHNVEIRVKSFLATSAGLLSSNVLKFVITPYAIPPKVNPPGTGKLFITGSATPASWQCGCGEPELLSQKFNQVTPTLYELPSIALTGGGSYLLLPQYGSWSAKFGGTGANNANNVNGDDFKDGGGDLLAPAVSGNYKIVVNFQTGKFTVTKL